MENGQARWARALAAPARAAILRHLRGTGAADAAQLAAAVGLHVNTTRHHLGLLLRAGLVDRETESPTRPGRPRVRYRATASVASGYEQLTAVLAEEITAMVPDPPRSAISAGRRWAARAEPAGDDAAPATADQALTRLVEVLDRLGFAPRTEPLRDRIYLHACPFAGAARHSPEVICGVHLGLLRGLLERMKAPLVVTAVTPMVRPGVCVAHITPGPVTLADARSQP